MTEYTSNQKTLYITYTWANGDWVGVTKEVWAYTSNTQTYETYAPSGNDWNITTRAIEGYDAAGNINLAEEYTFEGGVMTGTKKEEYQYDADRNMTELVRYTWTGTSWEYFAKGEAAYQGANKTLEAYYVWTDGAWVGYGTRTVKEFDGDNETLVLTYTWDTEIANWLYSTRRVIVRNANNKLVGDTTYHYINSEWVNYALETHGYDTRGNDTLAVIANWSGTEWVPTNITKGTYQYTASGKPLLVETYTGLEGAWEGITKNVYAYATYNGEEKLTSYRQYDWKKGKWADKTQTTRNYDEDGNILLDESYSWSGTTKTGTYKYEYRWENKRKVSEAQYRWDKNKKKWKGFSRNDQTFAEDGRILTNESYSWNTSSWSWIGSTREENRYEGTALVEFILKLGEGSGWTNYTRETYGDGLHVYTHQYRWKSSQWLMTSRTDRFYDDDVEGKLRREIDGSWDNSGNEMSYIDKLYFYSTDTHFFKIRFVNYDGTVLDSKDVEENQTPVYEGAEPAKPATAQYTYSFKGWAPSPVPAVAHATYKAQFDSVVNRYRITWLNADNTELAVDSLDYGTTPSHEDLVKPNTAEWTYSFVGWTPAIITVTADATYKAQFDSIRNTYLVTFKNGEDTLQSAFVAYGTMPVYEGETPTKQADAQYTYAFNGWDAELVSVTGEATYSATFSNTINSYRITFKNGEDTLQSTLVAYGAMPEYVGAEPTKQADAQYAYSFNGWDAEIVSVTGEATYNATFGSTIIGYLVTFKNGADTLQSTLVAYGMMPVYGGETPTKQGDAQYSYAFNGWDAEIVSVTGEATYNATFSSTVNTYLVTFKNGDDILQSTQVAYGSMPEYTGNEPTKQADAQYTYSFNGWDAELVAVTGEATYNATFSSTVNNYRITFKNGVDTLQSTLVAYGTMPVYGGETPTKQADAQYTYSFNGWDAELVAVTGETTYNATFSSTVNNYTITWLLDDGTKIDEQSVAYGTTPSHTDAHKDNTAQYTITFVGWDKAFAAVTGDETYTAVFDSVVNRYTVIFYFEDGVTVLDSKEWKYGEMPSTSLIPSLPATPKYTYTFAGWSPELTPVTGNASYSPVFDSIVNTYTVTFVNYNNMVLQSSQVPYDDVPEYTAATPTKPSSYKYHYVFAGWTPEIVAVTGDARYKAVYDQVLNRYTIIFYDEDGITILDSVEVDYGEMPETSVIPTKADDEEYTYTFAGWSPKIVSATKNTSYTATYTAKLKTEGLWDVEAEQKVQKVMIDGVIYILRGDKKYTLDGTEVK